MQGFALTSWVSPRSGVTVEVSGAPCELSVAKRSALRALCTLQVGGSTCRTFWGLKPSLSGEGIPVSLWSASSPRSDLRDQGRRGPIRNLGFLNDGVLREILGGTQGCRAGFQPGSNQDCRSPPGVKSPRRATFQVGSEPRTNRVEIYRARNLLHKKISPPRSSLLSWKCGLRAILISYHMFLNTWGGCTCAHRRRSTQRTRIIRTYQLYNFIIQSFRAFPQAGQAYVCSLGKK